MADNFLEYQREAFEARKAKKERERKKRPGMSAPSVRPRGINYALLFTILGSVLVVLIATVFVPGIKTSTGQLYLMHAVSGNPDREAKVISMMLP